MIPKWLKWLLKWFSWPKEDNNGLNSEEIAKKANALRKCVTKQIDLNDLNDIKMT